MKKNRQYNGKTKNNELQNNGTRRWKTKRNNPQSEDSHRELCVDITEYSDWLVLIVQQMAFVSSKFKFKCRFSILEFQ